MSTFIGIADWEEWVDKTIIDQITSNDDSKLGKHENMAIQMVRDAASGKYDMDTELGKTGDSRNETLIRYVMSGAVYFLYNSVNDLQVPDRVLQNYEDVRDELKLISSGKMNVEFDRLEDPDNDGDITNFKYGSEDRRENNPY